jgi:hypothetical protein
VKSVIADLDVLRSWITDARESLPSNDSLAFDECIVAPKL